MADYKTMYFRLAGRVADAIEILQEAQMEAEALYLDGSNQDNLILLDKPQESHLLKKVDENFTSRKSFL